MRLLAYNCQSQYTSLPLCAKAYFGKDNRVWYVLVLRVNSKMVTTVAVVAVVVEE